MMNYATKKMNRIKSLRIQGFKKFDKLFIEFNNHLNVIVGGNEAGKSTILEAIQILINQNYRNTDKSALKDLFNRDSVEHFLNDPSIESLPQILIEAELDLEELNANNNIFFGADSRLYDTKTDRFGIRFSCCFDESCLPLIEQSIKEGEIPYEFYLLNWETFAGHSYKVTRPPFKLLAIDTSQGQVASSFNYYNKTLFRSKYEELEKNTIKHAFRSGVERLFENLPLNDIGENRLFGLDIKKMILENIISVIDNGIPLENHGSGMENLIKTQIALERTNNIDVLLLEEPENHLSFPTLKMMIAEISSQKDDLQIILVTHSGMVSSGLNLINLLWISGNKVKSLRDLDTDDADFFVKASDNSVLQGLLSEKVLLVEGAAEFILIPKLYKQSYGSNLESAGITMISCNGLSYKRYLKILDMVEKRVAVLTDHDNNNSKLEYIKDFNEKHTYQQIFTDSVKENWTFEAALYNGNKSILEKLIQTQENAKYLFHGKSYGPVLGKMLNNKAESAYCILNSGINIEVPEYIKEAFEWLRK